MLGISVNQVLRIAALFMENSLGKCQAAGPEGSAASCVAIDRIQSERLTASGVTWRGPGVARRPLAV